GPYHRWKPTGLLKREQGRSDRHNEAPTIDSQPDPHFITGLKSHGLVKRTTIGAGVQDHRVSAIFAAPFECHPMSERANPRRRNSCSVKTFRIFPRLVPEPTMCGGQSISHRPAPAATEPLVATTNHARYSSDFIRASSQGRNFVAIESSAASSW